MDGITALATAPAKHIRTLSDREFLASGGYWDQAAGDRVCDFLETFITLDNGNSFELMDWQRDFIESVYCWKRPDNTRRVKIALLTLGRKNGKTELLAGLTLFHLIADNELSASCVSCAVDRAQAAQIYEKCVFSIKNNKKLSEALVCTDSYKQIKFPAGNSSYKSASSDAAGKFGHGHVFVVYDELGFHKNDKLYTALQNSTDAKANGLQIIISTSSFNKNGVFYRLYEYSKSILSDSVVDPAFMPWVYETPDNINLDDVKNWHLANPSMKYGVIREEDFRSQWERAKRDTAGRLDFLRLKFNCWTDAKTTWISAEKWAACKGTLPNLNGAPVHIGLDAGHLSDIFAISLIFPVDQKCYIKSYGFLPSEALEKDKQNSIAYQRAQLDGSLKIIKGNSVGVINDIMPFLDDIINKYDVKSITVDMWQLRTLAEHYTNKGLNVTEMPQKHYRFNEATKAFETAINDKTIVHDGDTLLTWQFNHCQLDTNTQGYSMPSKANESQKIDNVIASVMAYQQVMAPEVVAEDCVYNTKTLEFFRW